MMAAFIEAIATTVAESAAGDYRMTVGGWVIMIASIVVMSSLLGWCIYKVFATPGSETHLHSQSDIEPPDKE